MERHSRVDADIGWYTFIGPPPPPDQIVFDRDDHPVKGTPGERNWAATVIATPAGPTRFKTRTPRPPTPLRMVINEFVPAGGHRLKQDRVIDVYDEFIEVKFLGADRRGHQRLKLDNISSRFERIPSCQPLLARTNETGPSSMPFLSRISLHDSGGTVHKRAGNCDRHTLRAGGGPG